MLLVLADCKYTNEFVKLHLVKCYCLPLLTYCIGLLDLASYKVKDLGACWNDTFRKIFGYSRWESVTEFSVHYCHEIPFEYIYEICKWNFLHHSKNTSIGAVFIDMHSAIMLLMCLILNMEMLPILVVLESVLFDSVRQCDFLE